eukprot:scaffold12252_cov93-Isochrysis_galbana.AAC.2
MVTASSSYSMLHSAAVTRTSGPAGSSATGSPSALSRVSLPTSVSGGGSGPSSTCRSRSRCRSPMASKTTTDDRLRLGSSPDCTSASHSALTLDSSSRAAGSGQSTPEDRRRRGLRARGRRKAAHARQMSGRAARPPPPRHRPPALNLLETTARAQLPCSARPGPDSRAHFVVASFVLSATQTK